MLWGIRPPIGVRHFADRAGRYPPRPSASEICIILRIIPKPNSIILFYYSFEIFLSSKQACLPVHFLQNFGLRGFKDINRCFTLQIILKK